MKGLWRFLLTVNNREAKWVFSILVLTTLSAHAAPKELTFKGPDGASHAALYVRPKTHQPVFILHHGLASSKAEWTPLLTELENKGWGALAYDARPPGTPWKILVNDMGAALRYLEQEQKIERRFIFLGGASLGANVALKYHVLTSNGAGIVLLSPGLDYQGLTTHDLITQITSPVLLVASHTDRYAYQSCEALHRLVPSVAFWSDVKPGHGVQMFDPALLKRLIAWAADHAPNARAKR
jgi:acetyl esterase/lipase